MHVVTECGRQQAGRYPCSLKIRYAFLKTATPAHSRISGIDDGSFLLEEIFNQSSSRPTMIVHTGPISEMGLFSASRRCNPLFGLSDS